MNAHLMFGKGLGERLLLLIKSKITVKITVIAAFCDRKDLIVNALFEIYFHMVTFFFV